MTPEASLAENLRQAAELYRQGDTVGAEGICRHTLEQDPAEPNALRLLGVIAYQQNDLNKAYEYLAKALSVTKDFPRAHFDFGTVLFKLGRFEEAVGHLERASQFFPNSPELHALLGDVHHKLCNFDEAAEYYRRALAEKPELPAPRSNLLLLEQRRNQIATAAAAFRAVVEGKSRVPPLPPELGLENRRFLPYFLNAAGLVGVGAEVGVQEGNFSAHHLKHWQGRVLYSIDPWRELPPERYADSANLSQDRQDEFYRSTIRRLMPFEGRSVIWRLTSKEAANLLPDRSLDFCYIDADHSYEAVRDDLRTWFPKIKPGGLLCGHDYICDGKYWFGVFGVKRAVDEFIAAHSLPWFLSGEAEAEFPSWFIIKLMASGN